MKSLLADPKTLLALIVAVLAGIGILFYAFFRPSADPEEAERKRRLHLNQVGRIAEGQVVELSEHPVEEDEEPKGMFGAMSPCLLTQTVPEFILLARAYAFSRSLDQIEPPSP